MLRYFTKWLWGELTQPRASLKLFKVSLRSTYPKKRVTRFSLAMVFENQS